MPNAKDIIMHNLDRYGYAYTERAKEIKVEHAFNLRTTIDLSQEGKVLITERLEGWNVLTGLVRTKDLDRAVRYTWIGMAFVYLLGFVLMTTMEDKDAGRRFLVFLQLISMSCIVVTLSGTVYYLVKAEGFRQIVTYWTKELSPVHVDHNARP